MRVRGEIVRMGPHPALSQRERERENYSVSIGNDTRLGRAASP